jgi:hypothetical protein
VAGAIISISESGTPNAIGGAGRGSQIGSAFISVLFYAFGIFVAHRYSAMGLRVVRIIFCFSLIETRKNFVH